MKKETLTSDDGKYVGEVKVDEPHGQGTAIWASGEKYVGEWKDGKRHGQGINTFVSGEKYIGEFLESHYKNFLENCKDLKKKYNDNFRIIMYPYSLGTIKWEQLLLEFDNAPPEEVLKYIRNLSFVKSKNCWDNLMHKLFG